MPTAQETYAMLENQSLWATATRVHELLAAQSIPHALVGGMAVCLHGYQRNSVDVDLLVRGDDSEAVPMNGNAAPVHVHLAGERAGTDSEVRLPDPDKTDVVVTIEGLPVVSLARLIETKIACGEGNLRRTHKDFADVVELIARHQLGGDFARHLHKSVRRTYRRLVKHAQGDSP